LVGKGGLGVFQAKVVVNAEGDGLADADAEAAVKHVLLVVETDERRFEFTERHAGGPV